MKKSILLIFVFTQPLFVSAQDKALSDEEAVKAVVESFLLAAGNYDLDAIPAIFSKNANIGGATLKNGKWQISTMTLVEFLEILKSEDNPKKYTEPVSKYTIHISEGKLAFVKADAILSVDGEPKTYNFDYFTLIKVNDKWKILNGSYVSIPFNK